MIEVKNLTKRYGSKLAVDDASFRVNEGEILGFLGSNGAGKSTTMNIITGYLSASEGRVSVSGHDILDEPLLAKACIGYLPEHPPLYPAMTVEEYLGFVFDLKNVRLPRSRHICEVCERVKIGDMRSRVIGNLSKGYRQRLGVAQALLGYPPILILDEPTVGIDPMQMIDMRGLIKDFGQKHTVIFSSHILSEVEAVCDRVVVINHGRIVADDTPGALARNFGPKHKQTARIDGPSREILEALGTISGMQAVTLLGSNEEGSCDYLLESAPGVDLRREVFFRLAEKGWPLLLVPTEVSLEEIFLRLVDSRDAEKPEENL